MTPSYLAATAERLYPKRVALAVLSLLCFAALLAVAQFLPRVLPVVVPLAGPLVFLPWIVFCACTWFHPERGTLRPKQGGRIALVLREATRWYAAIFTAVGVVVAIVVWPALAVLWL